MENTDNRMIVFEAQQMFSVPSVITDKYINAGYAELRLILLLLRNVNTGFSRDTLLGRLNITGDELDAAFAFWVKEGILFKQGDKYVLERPRIRASDIMTYSADEISERIDGDCGIRFLYNKTEEILAKPLTTSDASVVLSLVDWVGLPSDVAAMLLQYCSDSGRCSLRQIEKTGIEWAEKEINTAERADAFIAAEKKKRETVSGYCRVIGIADRALTEGEKKVFSSWSQTMCYGQDIIAAAYDITVRATGKYSYQYMDKIITGWYSKDVKTAEEAAKVSEEGRPAPKKAASKPRFTPNKNTDTVKAIESSWAIIDGELEDEGQGEKQ